MADYHYLINDRVDELNLDEALQHVSQQRREKALAFRHGGGRRLSVAAYLLLCDLLRQHYDIEELPILQETPDGKPFLKDYPAIHFNLSHTRGVAACVVSRQPVGIDVERIRPLNNALARRVLTPAEYQHVKSSAEPDIEFIHLWTKKEALLKLIGTGIRAELDTVNTQDSHYRFETIINRKQQYICTLCTYKQS